MEKGYTPILNLSTLAEKYLRDPCTLNSLVNFFGENYVFGGCEPIAGPRFKSYDTPPDWLIKD